MTDTPKDEEPMQVSVSVVVSAGATTAGAVRIVWVDGV